MSGFDPRWLALREPADQRSRAVDLMRLALYPTSDQQSAQFLDLGCGTGATLRALAPLGPSQQAWTLIDHDPDLLAAARTELTRWSDAHRGTGDRLQLKKGDRTLTIRFRRADLRALDFDLTDVDLVTCSALLDLVSQDWAYALCTLLAETRTPFLALLTYSGGVQLRGGDALSVRMSQLFDRHMRTDKGFGPALGGDAANVIGSRLMAAGYDVSLRASPWVLGQADAALATELARGWASAVQDMLTREPEDLDPAAWLAGLGDAPAITVPHWDLYAVWPTV